MRTRGYRALWAAVASSLMAVSAVAQSQNQNLSDGQIVQIVKTADQSEIDAAKVAKDRAYNPKVKDFARYLLKEHKKNLKQDKNLDKKLKINEEPSDISQNLKSESQTAMDALKNSNGTNFDQVYMEQQVATHKKVLEDLNQSLIPSAKDPKLKNFLETTRDHIQQHLSKAQSIQETLKR